MRVMVGLAAALARLVVPEQMVARRIYAQILVNRLLLTLEMLVLLAAQPEPPVAATFQVITTLAEVVAVQGLLMQPLVVPVVERGEHREAAPEVIEIVMDRFTQEERPILVPELRVVLVMYQELVAVGVAVELGVLLAVQEVEVAVVVVAVFLRGLRGTPAIPEMREHQQLITAYLLLPEVRIQSLLVVPAVK